MANPSHDLLPCPFCQNADLCTEMGSTPSPGDYIMCDGPDGCGAMISRVDTPDDDLIGAWNRRATPPSPSTAPEAFENLQRYDLCFSEDDDFIDKLDKGRYLKRADVLALASRPAEVDDEGLPELPRPVWWYGGTEPYFSAEQYRQGQRDAVAADRARRKAGGGEK